MADKPYFPKITAGSVEQFQALEKIVKKLPQQILDQIDLVDSKFRTQLHFKEQYTKEPLLVLPKTVTQIQPFDDYIGIYCEPDLFFMYKIDKEKPFFLKYLFV